MSEEYSEEARVTAMGLLNLGKTYLDAARYLYENVEDWQTMAFPGPIQFCLGHGLELIMKAHLRARYETLEQIRARGHDLLKLWQDAVASGLDVQVNAGEIENLNQLNQDVGKAPYEARYFRRGLKPLGPDYEVLLEFGQRTYWHLFAHLRIHRGEQSRHGTDRNR